MTGSSGFVSILNGLGHCISLPCIMSYESAIAQLVINNSNVLPKEFLPGQHVNLVYDNIDFGEKSTTQKHATDEIIIQKKNETSLFSNFSTVEHSRVIKKKQRTVSVPNTTIAPYKVGDKIPMVSQIGYLPVVDAPTTEYSTLMEVLKKSISIIDSLELQHCVLVFVYAKIPQIK